MGLECMRGVTVGLPLKFQALLVFVLFTMNNGFAWLMFDPVTSELEALFDGMSDAQLQLLSSWQPLMYIVAFFPTMRLMTRYDGLRWCVRLGASAELIGAVLKLIATSFASRPFALYVLHMGQIFSAVGSPVAIGAVSGLSAQWFEAHERTRATAAAVLSNNVGNAVCYLLVPAMTTGVGFIGVTVYEVCTAIVACSLAWLAFPQQRNLRSVRRDMEALAGIHPHRHGAGGDDDSSGGVEEEIALLPQLRGLFSHPSAVLLLAIYSWSSGGYVAWTSMFDAMLGDFYDSQFLGTVSFAGTVAYVIGGLIASYLTDLYFYRHMKHVIFVCMTLNTASCLLFIASVPDARGQTLWDLGGAWVVFVASLCGFFNGAAAPIFYELVAEITYPVDEGVSGNVMSMCENMGALVLYQVVARLFAAQSMNYAFAGGMAVTIGLAAMVNQQYKRSYAALPKDDAASTNSISASHREDVTLSVDMQDLRTYSGTTDLASSF